jgi:HSP20 family protein
MNRNYFRMDFPGFDNRLFESLQNSLYKVFEDELGGTRARRARGVFPPVNISDGSAEYLLSCELPGINKEDIDLQVAGNKLTISGEVHCVTEEGWSLHRREREHGKFSRTFTLPEDADGQNVAASFDEGILTVTIAKSEQSLPRKISIVAG